ncbi:MAG: hypothetical protein ACYDCL_00245 [Myxococcales bacterium]
MRQLVAVCCLAWAAGCAFQPVGDGPGGGASSAGSGGGTETAGTSGGSGGSTGAGSSGGLRGGSSGANVCHTTDQACVADADCCPGFNCTAGQCLFAGTSGGTGGVGLCTSGNPPFVGSWSGTFSVTETLGSGSANGGGGGGRDEESVEAGGPTGEIVFKSFLSALFPGCTLDFQIEGPGLAGVAVGSSCQDSAGGGWTFSSGGATLFGSVGPCAMAVSLFGTFSDPGQSGTFALSVTLTP